MAALLTLPVWLHPSFCCPGAVFPGLGWMLTRAVGLELLPTWPPGFWDDNHLRKPKIRKGRQCIYPEVPRTHTFGADGASNGMFFSDHLDNMIINTQDVDWTQKVRSRGVAGSQHVQSDGFRAHVQGCGCSSEDGF